MVSGGNIFKLDAPRSAKAVYILEAILHSKQWKLVVLPYDNHMASQLPFHQIDNLNMVPSPSIGYWTKRELFLLRNSVLFGRVEVQSYQASGWQFPRILPVVGLSTSYLPGFVVWFVFNLHENRANLNLRSQRNGDNSLLKHKECVLEISGSIYYTSLRIQFFQQEDIASR